MGKLVFKLRSVSDEEADGVRRALEAAEIAFYETSAGTWGWSLPAIWVTYDDDYPAARAVIDTFQACYVEKLRQEGQTASRPNYLKLAIAVVLSAVVIYLLNYIWLKEFL